jgi:hypothetical protein
MAYKIDLSRMPEAIPKEFRYLFEMQIVDAGNGYLGHPDSVTLKNGDILTVYPKGHGKGEILNKISSDGGVSYAGCLQNTPLSWKNSRETPTIYRLEFSKPGVADKLILISGNPQWGNEPTTGGFNCSLSQDEGKTWSEFRLFHAYLNGSILPTVVAMSSLTKLKENGRFVDKWMGLFHDHSFNNYKTVLTFDEKGNMEWSIPEKYFGQHEQIEKESNMCEVEVIRSDKGQGDELCLISRSNTKKCNSLISFSQDEGKTWSEPKEVPDILNGERHKAEYTSDGRLIVTFRSIERNKEKLSQYSDIIGSEPYYSEGLTAWVGTYDDLKKGTDGQYRIKLAHTYLSFQNEPHTVAGKDTGYCGNVVLADDTVVISSYGKFSPNETYMDKEGVTQRKTL